MLNVQEKINETIQEIAVGVENRELSADVLLSDLGIDSMKYVELLVQIEEKFDIVFDESDLGVESLRNIGDLEALIHKTIAQSSN
ncbi:MAG: acyl carrier protein [Bacilli bacterium]|nr:acyl carrier protein [Bacilli bacterium]